MAQGPYYDQGQFNPPQANQYDSRPLNRPQQGFNWGSLLRAGSFLGGPWGKGLGIGAGILGGLWGANKFGQSAMDLSRQRMNFMRQGMQQIPGLAAAFRQHMIQGSGGEQANILGGAQAFTSSLGQRANASGVNNLSGIGQIRGALGDSLAGMGMSQMYGRYNQQAFDMANQDTMQSLMAALTNYDQRNQLMGGVLGTGGDLMSRALFPRTYG